MKMLVLVIFLFFSFDCYAQEFLESNKKDKHDIHDDKFPFQIGVEGGGIWEFTGSSKQTLGLLVGYVNVDLNQKKTFLKFEFGKIFELNRKDDLSGLLSFGVEVKFLNTKKHNFSYYAGISLVGGKGFAAITFPVSLRYLYYFNKVIGITGSIKFPAIPFRFYPAATIGIQLN